MLLQRSRHDWMKYLLALVLGYGLIVLAMYAAQTTLIFPGTRLSSRPLNRPFLPERLVIERPAEPARNGEEAAGDGATVLLHGMLFTPTAEATSSGEDLVIAFGGNAQDAELLGQELADRLPEFQVAVFHYRGYGPSGGRPGEAALLQDALAIHDRLAEKLRPERVFALGISLGSGIAAWLAAGRPIAGALLVTPYDSLLAVARESYFWLPVDRLLRHRFESDRILQGRDIPVAIIAAAEDRVISPARTDALRQAVPNLVFDQTLPDVGHNDLYGAPAYGQALRDAMAALQAAGGIAATPASEEPAPSTAR
jgi:pimeloyl-ACP methyl ester carboxylesterase